MRRAYRDGGLCNFSFNRLFASDDVNADVAAAADEVMHHGAVQHFEPSRPRGFADDYVRDVVLVCEIDDVDGNAAPPGGDGDRLALEPLGQAQYVRDAVPVLFAELQAPPGFDVQGRPGRVQAVGQSLGVAYETDRAWILADANDDPFARGPRPLNSPGLHVLEQLLIHALGSTAQSELAQRRQVGGREIVPQRAFGLLRNVDLALLEALDQIIGGQIDKLDRVRLVHHRVRARFREREDA